MSLGSKGIISVVEIIFYVPILLLSNFLIYRYGFSFRSAGWFYLATFSIARVVGGIISIHVDENNNSSQGLAITSFILQSAGLSPLMIAAISFLGLVGEQSRIPPRTTIFRILHLELIVAVTLAIIGGTEATSSKPNTINQGTILRKVGSLIILGVYLSLVLLHGSYWLKRGELLKHRRMLLIGISCALPFLAVRTIYSILGAFSPSPFSTEHNALSDFNIVTGTWQALLFGAVLPEFCVVVIYCTAGTILPLSKEIRDHEADYKGIKMSGA